MKVNLSFDEKVFSKEAVLATCYCFADRMVADINSSRGSIVVTFVGRGNFVVDEKAIENFKTMVVHNQLRHQLKEKFGDLEKTIIEKAFRPINKE